MQWRHNLRANLALWPQVSLNISTACQFHLKEFDEKAFLAAIPSRSSEKTADDERSARNTVEVMALAGLSYVDEAKVFHLTNLGQCLFTFLGTIGGKRYANERNRALLSEALIRGLSTVIEYRAIWTLMRAVGNKLSNEELNRSMACIRYLEDIPACAEAVSQSRAKNDPSIIGPRLYENEKYGTAKHTDQRKAMNPLFLLSGGGKIFLDLNSDDGFRRLEDWAIPMIDQQLSEPAGLIHASTEPSAASAISDNAALPEYWGKL